MIICPNCLHQNTTGAAACEACFTGLPEQAISCPHCGQISPIEATYCPQCGTVIQPNNLIDDLPAHLSESSPIPPESDFSALEPVSAEPPELGNLDFPLNEFQAPEPLPLDPVVVLPSAPAATFEKTTLLKSMDAVADEISSDQSSLTQSTEATRLSEADLTPLPEDDIQTGLQDKIAALVHQQTQARFELTHDQFIFHIGKPNEERLPDIDVSRFPDATVVSRRHARVQVENQAYFIEDLGSANGTFVNKKPILVGSRCRLQSGDVISLGKGDLVSFIFELY
jgi:ribosomal protein L40E